MAIQWHIPKIPYPGVRYREHSSRKHNGVPDQYFTIRYKINGILKEEGLGWASQGWNAGKASIERNNLVKAKMTGEGPTTLAEKRQLAMDKKEKELAEKEKLAKESITFASFFTGTYFPNAKVNKSEKSWIREHSLYKIWINKEIGPLSFKDITNQHLERIKTTMAEGGQSARSIRYALAVIRQVFNYARASKVFAGPSPIENVKFPQSDNKRLRFLTQEEAVTLLQELKKRSTQLHDIALVSLRTGARADEIFSLKWGDIDFTQNSMTLWDTKNTKTRVARITPDIKILLQDKRSADFSPDEFQVRQSAKALCKAIHLDFDGLPNISDDPIEWLNSLLTRLDLFKSFMNRTPRVEYSTLVEELIDKVKSRQGKAMEKLKDIEMDNLKRLNRLLMEETYPLKTPKSPEKTTRDNNDLVFPDRNGKKIISISSSFERAVNAIGLNENITDPRRKVVFHTLRHTYASWLVDQKVELYTVKALLGHSSISMTERYAHVSDKAKDEAVKKLGSINLDTE